MSIMPIIYGLIVWVIVRSLESGYRAVTDDEYSETPENIERK